MTGDTAYSVKSLFAEQPQAVGWIFRMRVADRRQIRVGIIDARIEFAAAIIHVPRRCIDQQSGKCNEQNRKRR